MKRYFAALSLCFSMECLAQITTPKTMQMVDTWFPTPAKAIEFLQTVRPQDANDIKEFMRNSRLDSDKRFPGSRLKGNKIYLNGLSEPIIWSLDGSFTFKAQPFRYDRKLSFKKNLEKFDQRWGTLKEFGNWNRQSRFEALIFSQAYAGESEVGFRSWLLKLDLLSVLGVQDSSKSFDDEDKKMRSSARNNANHITCGEKPILLQKSLALRIDKVSATTVFYSAYPRNGKDSTKLAGKVDLNELPRNRKIETDLMPTEYRRMSLGQSLRTLIDVCKTKSEKWFNEDSLRSAEFIEMHKLLDRSDEKFETKDVEKGSAPSRTEGTY
jgi:hypothetical protein